MKESEEKNENLIDDTLEQNKKKEEEEEKDEKEKEKEDKKNEEVKLLIENDENKELITQEDKDEKSDLLKIMQRLEVDLVSDEYETLNQIYGQYINNEDITKRNIKQDTSRRELIFMFYIISPLFGIINLIGIFESISIMNVMFQILKNSIVIKFKSLFKKDPSEIELFSINDFNSNYNFYNMFYEDTKHESFDFNLMMFTAFLGDILLRSRGFRISIAVFGVLNGLAIFLILSFPFDDYEQDDNTYTIFQLLYILLCWFLLFIGAGASALLSQQIIVDSNLKYNRYLKELNEATEKKWKERQKIWEDKKNEKDKLQHKKESTSQNVEDELKEIKNEDTSNEETKKEEVKDNLIEEEENEADIKKSQSESNLNLKDNDNEEAFKNIINSIKEVGKSSQKYRKAKTIMTKDIIEVEEKQLVEKKQPKKKRKKKETDENEKKKKKSQSFFMICLTTIIGYFFKYLLNMVVVKSNENKTEFYRNEIGCFNDTICFDNILKDNNFSVSESAKFSELLSMIYSNERKSFYSIFILYILCIMTSIILYSIFVCIFTKNQKKKSKDNSYRVCEICGYTIYSENIILNPSPPCCECCKLLCETSRNCFCMVLNSLCRVCIEFIPFIDEEDKNEDICQKDCCCCCCCCDFQEENDYKKNNGFFCYCYQAKRRQNWFNKFITSNIQVKIFPYMLEYFILQILTIAFEKQYLLLDQDNEINYHDNNNSSNYTNFTDINLFSLSQNVTHINTIEEKYILNIEDLYVFITFIITFFLFFYFSLSFDNMAGLCKDHVGGDKKKGFEGIAKLSNGILDGIHGILIFDGLFSLIFSSLYLSDEEHEIFKNTNFFLIPILMNKFFYFTLTYYCISYSEEKKQFELISGSTLISIYLVLWDTIISFIREYTSLFALYIIQTVISSIIPGLIILFFVIVVLIYCIFGCECGGNLSILTCFLSFIFLFGGFWFTEDMCDNIENGTFDCDCDCECFEDSCYICYDICNFFSCFDCFCWGLCDCCDCCECYDCCGCCSCFYCCGDSCTCYGC